MSEVNDRPVSKAMATEAARRGSAGVLKTAGELAVGILREAVREDLHPDAPALDSARDDEDDEAVTPERRPLFTPEQVRASKALTRLARHMVGNPLAAMADRREDRHRLIGLTAARSELASLAGRSTPVERITPVSPSQPAAGFDQKTWQDARVAHEAAKRKVASANERYGGYVTRVMTPKADKVPARPVQRPTTARITR